MPHLAALFWFPFSVDGMLVNCDCLVVWYLIQTSMTFCMFIKAYSHRRIFTSNRYPVRSCEWPGGTPSIHWLYLVSGFCLGVGVWASLLPPAALLWSPRSAGLCCKSLLLGTQLCSRACSVCSCNWPVWCRANVIIRKGGEDFPGSCEMIPFC